VVQKAFPAGGQRELDGQGATMSAGPQLTQSGFVGTVSSEPAGPATGIAFALSVERTTLTTEGTMRRHILSCFAVAIALAGVTGAVHAQSTSQNTAQDTSQASDSAAQGKHHKRHKMTSNGSVADSAKNQSQSGVMDSSGKSTLGSRIKKTTPTQGQPVTAKGDTLRPGNSSKSTPPDTTRPTSPQ
jgi:hypothetical protein